MAEQFPRASNTEVGGTAMIPALLVSSDILPPIRRSLIGTAGKKRVDFDYNGLFAGDFRLIGYRNPIARQKNLPHTGETQLVPAGEMDEKIDGLLTTSHMFWPDEPRKPGFLLPIRLPNPSFLASKRNGRGQEGGRGVSRGGGAESPVSISFHGNFGPSAALRN